MKDNINQFPKGLHTDNSPVTQPKGTVRFVLNGVNETDTGDIEYIANEESNEICGLLPDDYIPLGKVYIGDNETLLFSVSPDETLSEIGIQSNNCEYRTVVNADLGFKITEQIQATYRLRRGCEKTIYWVDPRPRILNLNRLDDFKTLGVFDPLKFDLFKTYNKIPVFQNIEVLEEGNLPAGSYNAAIQYLDNDLNPTEWIVTTDTIMIYNSHFNINYKLIEGSTNKITQYQNFGLTNKSIKFTLSPSSIDTNYPFYRLAIIESNAGTGQVTAVKFTQEISTDILTFNYTGASAGIGTEEEILAFNNIIDSAITIGQVENKLLLAGTKGKQINFCKLQSYASRIRADLITENIILNSIEFENNPKRATVHIEKVGYMPGEMYSYGIVYVFTDSTLSPVYHIPGRSWNTIASTGYSSSMSFDNKLEDTFYTDNNSCIDNSYWGVDSEGIPLLNQPVRHHRFPLRSEVNEPLIVEEIISSDSYDVNTMTLDIQGTIVSVEEIIEYKIEYTVDGNPEVYEGYIIVETYDPAVGIQFNIANSINTIAPGDVYENDIIVTTTSPSGLTYTLDVEQSTVDTEDKLYTSNIFGIKFSGIEIPLSEDIDGEEIIGYYIVRNERTEEEKSIVDTAVLTPLITNSKFVSHGHLMPNFDNANTIKNDMLAMIHPEHRFGQKEYKNIDTIILEGEYILKDRTYSSVILQDVLAGTSYDRDASKRRENDNDGFSLHVLARDNELKYTRRESIFAEGTDIKEIFYLDTLNSKLVNDIAGLSKEVFNISGDNKIGILQLDKTYDTDRILTRLPFVILKRNLSNQYSNFRVIPYYNEMETYTKFITDEVTGDIISGDTSTVYNGDVFITPMRYHSAVFYDIKLRKRATKKGLWNYILGVVAIIVGAVVAVVGTVVGATALGVMLISYGVSSIASGIKKDNIAKVYMELYEAGLRETVADKDTAIIFGPNPADDEIQWLGDTLTNIWFESTANMAMRQGATVNIPDFLPAPDVQAIGFPLTQGTSQNELDAYLIAKLTVLDTDYNDGRLYQGFPTAELYEINPDYRRRNKQKVFFHLGLEYRCCTDCLEDFPHRVHYSEQSFQEELTDNYRVFLPNNYRDIEGEGGTITDIYRIQNNIYIHTTESLWHLPGNYQERITGDIVSFLGTGEFFATPPRKIVDDDKASAGNKHKWAREKTKHGIFFPSENEGKVYQFNGNDLKPISDLGNASWFKQNLKLKLNEQYMELTGRNYPYDNNPSNPFGIGFISVYDTLKERWILTKKDFLLSDEITDTPDFELCVHDGVMHLFPNFTQTIADMEDNGFEYVGMEECRMKFQKTEYILEEQERTIEVSTISTADVYVFYDTSGSFLAPQLAELRAAVDIWFAEFQDNNPLYTGSIFHIDTGTERWVNFLNDSPASAGDDVILISFVNEAQGTGAGVAYAGYHNAVLENPVTGQPGGLYQSDYVNFVIKFNTLNSFIGINYPIVTSNAPYTPMAKAFVQHSLLAAKGEPYTLTEFNALERNTAFSDAEWLTLKNSLLATNPYEELGPGLEDYNWKVKSNKHDLGTPESDNCPAYLGIISSCQLAEDINIFLGNSITTETILVSVLVPVVTYEYVEGTIVTDPIKANASWTMSYNLKNESWRSWHSYLPSFYFYISDKFYSWLPGNDNLWRHNRKHHYQTFYGVFYPHIIEYVSNPEELKTKIWNHLRLLTEAKSFNTLSEDYVDERDITFNKLIAYNTRQSTGLMNLKVKDTQLVPKNYLLQQIQNTATDIIIDRNERDWTINDLRDIRINYLIPIFNKDLTSLQPTYFMDKVLNTPSLNYDKDWTQLESFSDKYLVVRLIFDNFDTIRLITNFSVENEQNSDR